MLGAASGLRVYEAIKNDMMTKQFIELERVQNLYDQVKAGYIARAKTLLDAEEFFYNKAGSASKQRSKDEVLEELLESLGYPPDYNFTALAAEEQKKAYRRAAIAKHPDRNQGNGKAMSELNALWQEWSRYA
jgi:hypothetical protein